MLLLIGSGVGFQLGKFEEISRKNSLTSRESNVQAGNQKAEGAARHMTDREQVVPDVKPFRPEIHKASSMHFLSPDPGPVPAVEGDPDFGKVAASARLLIHPITLLQETLPENERALYLASHPEEDYLIRFLDCGVRILPWESSELWRMELALDTQDKPKNIRQDATRVEYEYDGIVEWFHNQSEGLEHGFVLTRPTPGAGGTTTISVGLTGLRAEPLAEREKNSSDLQFVDPDGYPLLAYTGLKVWDANGRTLPANMIPTSEGFVINVLTEGAAYPVTVDPLITRIRQQLGAYVTGYSSIGDDFGESLETTADQILIGAPGEGHVYIFEKILGEWEMVQVLKQEAREFGDALKVHGDWLVIGAYRDRTPETLTGAVYLYYQTGTEWIFHSKLVPPDGESWDRFGSSVALWNEWLAVGAPMDDEQGESSGSVQLFQWDGNNWTFRQKLTPTNGMADDQFGYRLAMDNGTLFVSAPNMDGIESDEGMVYIYQLQNETFQPLSSLQPNNLSAGSLFGFSMALEGQNLLIGGPGWEDGNGNKGGVFVYSPSLDTWQETQILTPDPMTSWLGFGKTVDIREGVACVGGNSIYIEMFTLSGNIWSHAYKVSFSGGSGAQGESHLADGILLNGLPTAFNAGSVSGVVNIFHQQGSDWLQADILSAGNAASRSDFGVSLDLNEMHSVIGAPKDADYGSTSGAVYLFHKQGEFWHFQQKLLLPEPESMRAFGTAVRLSGDRLLVGAPFNTFSFPGGYVYRLENGVWELEAEFSQLADGLGQSVDLDEDRAVLGAPGTWYTHLTTRDTSVFVYSREGTSWTLETELTPADSEGGNLFGWSVDLSGGLLTVGAPMDDMVDPIGFHSVPNAGSVYVYEKSGETWTYSQEIHYSYPVSNSGFGFCVDSTDEILVVGSKSIRHAIDIGTSFYTRNSSQWVYMNQSFTGSAVGISNQLAVVGEDEVKGSTYILEVNTSTSQVSLVQELENPRDDYTPFGKAVAIHGLDVLISSPEGDGMDRLGTEVKRQGNVFHFRITPLTVDIDNDGFDDAWETANGFDPSVTGDVGTRDDDGNGKLDVAEIFEGASGGPVGFNTPTADIASKTFKARYRRASNDTGLTASYRWSTDLASWHHPGATASSVKVDFTEQVVETGTGYEIVEVTATMSLGSADHLFIAIDLSP